MQLKDIITPQQLDELQAPLSHYRKALNNDWGLPSELVKFLKKQGYELLGDGAFSDVFAKPGEKFVLKVIRRNANEDCYLQYVKALQGKTNPHFPKIGRIREYKTEAGMTWYVIPVERLKRVTPPVFRKRPDCIFAYSYEAYSKPASLKNVHPVDYDEMVEKYPQLVEALKFIHSTFTGQCDMDLHSGNMMLRGDTLVLTDPIGFTRS